jgi:hypothetical protein
MLLVSVCPRLRRNTSADPPRHVLHTGLDAHILPGKKTLLPDWDGFCTSAAWIPLFTVAIRRSTVSTWEKKNCKICYCSRDNSV